MERLPLLLQELGNQYINGSLGKVPECRVQKIEAGLEKEGTTEIELKTGPMTIDGREGAQTIRSYPTCEGTA